MVSFEQAKTVSSSTLTSCSRSSARFDEHQVHASCRVRGGSEDEVVAEKQAGLSDLFDDELAGVLAAIQRDPMIGAIHHACAWLLDGSVPR